MNSVVQRILNAFGYELRRCPKKIDFDEVNDGSPTSKVTGVKVYVGCGDDFREGYIGCDVRKTDSVSVKCSAWELSLHFDQVDEIYSRHMLEHLTFGEMQYCLNDWYKTLRKGARVVIVVPNMDFHISQWSRASWNDQTMRNNDSDARWCIAGFWGWQNECDPVFENYNNSYWDVHKSGYNVESITYFLRRAGFENIECNIEKKCHLTAIGTK